MRRMQQPALFYLEMQFRKLTWGNKIHKYKLHVKL